MILQPRKLLTILCGCIALPSAFCLPGCGGPSPPQGSGTGWVTWDRFKEINPQAGIDKAQANPGIWRDDGLAFLILTDFVGSGPGRSGGKGTGPEKYEGQQKAPDGQKIDWQCETTDGKTGKMMINGSSYELAKGSLFLISTRDGQVRVRQLQRDLLKVKPDQEALESLLKNDPDVGPFFAEGAKPN
jgi:hypothetical protein